MQVFRRKSFVAFSLWALVAVGTYFGYEHALNRQFARAQEQQEDMRANLANAQNIFTAFRQVGKVVEPSVVSIDVHKKIPLQHPGLNEDFFRRFFPDRDGDGEPDLPPGLELPDEEDLAPEQIGTGSGVIMEYADGKGYILTNNHVAGGADGIEITLYDGRIIRNARIVGADPKTDLAVIEIQADRLVPAKWGNSDELQKGDWILAFGSPFRYVGSMTHGIVSATHRTDVGILGIGGYENFIQIDAPINPGNSGGPVVNLRGEVIGISTAIASRNGGFQGVGFAIPSNQARPIYQILKEKGKVVRGWLGVSIADVSKERGLARSFGYEGEEGILVQEVLPGAPAAGQLQRGDIILKISGKEVSNVQQLRNVIATMPPGEEVKLDVFRDGQIQAVTVKLGEQPDDLLAARMGERGEEAASGEASAAESLGFEVTTLNAELAQRRGLDITAGALITEVKRNSPAAREGLRPGDVIIEVGRTPIKNANDLGEALAKADLKKGVRMYVTSRAGSRFVFLSTEQ